MEKANKIKDVMSKDIPASEVKPSELLEVALHDMKLIDKDPRYSFDMTTWHYPIPYDDQESGECEVCMAGSIMAARLMPDACDKRLFPHSFEKETSIKLHAVESLRRLNVRQALCDLKNCYLQENLNLTVSQNKFIRKYLTNNGNYGDGFPDEETYKDLVINSMKYLSVYENLIKDLKSVDL